MALYKNVLHHTANEIPKWLLEVLGVYTSILNQCEYCIEHHYSGMSRLINDSERSKLIRLALETDNFSPVFDDKQSVALAYTKKLTLNPTELSKDDVLQLRAIGWNDGEILEINQVVAYFNYANRTVLGLGVYTEGDIIGLSPNESGEPDNWNHS